MAYTIRKATREDVPEIMRLVQELADYEKMSEGPQLTEQDFIRDGGFDGGQPFYHVHVADIAPGKLAGFVLYFWTYSTWEGKAVYMEDLYVSPDWRGKGAGKALWRACVQAAIDQGCSRCNWSCLDWNKPSIEFYKRMGAIDLTETEGWLSFRLRKQEMKDFCTNKK